MFSSKNSIVCGLTFRSLIHSEFVFVYGVRECSNFILFFGFPPEKIFFFSGGKGVHVDIHMGEL